MVISCWFYEYLTVVGFLCCFYLACLLVLLYCLCVYFGYGDYGVSLYCLFGVDVVMC